MEIASAASWSDSDVLSTDDPNRYGISGTGDWADQGSFNTPNMQKSMLHNFVSIISYKVIDYAWNDSQAFIAYVPHNTPIKDQNGNMQKAEKSQDWCESNLQETDDEEIFRICDAPGPVMAQLYSASSQIHDTGNNFNSLAPKGYNTPHDVVPGKRSFISGATHGSVASWIAGDFGYDLSKSYQPF